MYLFKIDAENRITAHAATRPLHTPKGEYVFVDPEDLYGLASGWPASRLVEIWNRLPDTKSVSRFATRKAAVQRIWGAIQKLQPVPLKTRGKTNPFDTRDGTKSSRVIALLRRPAGATLTEIMAETGWQAHSVRGFISGHLTRRLGLRIKSTKNAGERTYRIAKGEIA